MYVLCNIVPLHIPRRFSSKGNIISVLSDISAQKLGIVWPDLPNFTSLPMLPKQPLTLMGILMI